MAERATIESLLGNDNAWTQIVEAVGEMAVKVYLKERKREETYDRALANKKNPATPPKEKTWHEIGQELKPEILGWKWKNNG